MTDTAQPKDTTQFWSRVRDALNAVRPPQRQRQPAYGTAAIARSVGLRTRLGDRLEAALNIGWERAAAKRVSLSLLVIEIDQFGEYFAAYGKDAADQCLAAVIEASAKSLSTDTGKCLRYGRAGLVLVLPDWPGLMARASAEKIAAAVRALALPHKESHAGIVTASLGLAVVNPTDEYDRSFFEAAAEAVKRAQRKGLGRLEVVDLRTSEDHRKAA